MVDVWCGLADRSHYDDPMTDLDGMVGVTHKITEGDHFYLDAEYAADAARVRALGAPMQGSYHVQHGGKSVSAQADWWFQQVDLLSPFWRTHACWTWQDDAEKFDYMTAPTIAEINALGDAICARAQCPAERFIAYAPEWLYGVQLRGLRYRQWESSYVSGSGPWRTLYPGNTSSRWVTAAPGGPLLLQYTSSAVIAGQTTCDASGYRGSLRQLLSDLHAEMGDIDMFRVRFGTDWIDRPVSLGARVVLTDGLGHFWVEADGTPSGNRPDPLTITRASVSSTWSWARTFAEVTGGCVYTPDGGDTTKVDKNGIADWRLPSAGGITAAQAAGIADARIRASSNTPGA